MSINYLTVFIPTAIATAIVLAAVATRRVRRDVSFTPDQRGIQLWLIWLLPIIGAALVLSILHDEPRAEQSRQPPTRHLRG